MVTPQIHPDASPGAAVAVAEAVEDTRIESTIPRWLELATFFGGMCVVSSGLIGLACVLIDRFDPYFALVVGVVVAAGTTFRVSRALEPRRVTNGAKGAVLVVLLLAIAYGAFAARTPSSGVVLNRDPSSYAATGRWLADHDSLRLDGGDEAFAGINGLRFDTPGVYDMRSKDPGTGKVDPGQSLTLRLQFNHMVGVLLAIAHTFGGDSGMARLPAAMGSAAVLLVYLLASRLTKRPVVALIAPALMASNLALLHLVRNTYSESFTLVFVLLGALAGSHLLQRSRPVFGVIAGSAVGAATASRADAMVVIAIIAPLVAMGLVAGLRNAERRRVAITTAISFAATASLGIVLGQLDLDWLSGRYRIDLRSELSQLRTGTLAAIVLSAVGAALWLRLGPRLGPTIERIRGPVAVGAAVLVVVLLLFAWFVRPHVQEVHTREDNPTVVAIQKHDGGEIEGTRTYAESAVTWMAWYLGAPGFAAAILGLGVGVHAAIRRRVSAVHWIALAVCLGTGLLYWPTPRNTPDQPWVMRRYLSATLPLLAIWAAYGVSQLATWFENQKRFRTTMPIRAAAATVVFTVVLVPSVATVIPLRWQQQQAGYVQVINEACGLLPPKAAVVLVGSEAELTLPQAFRSWCNVPTASAGSFQGPDKLRELRNAVAANGYQLTIVSLEVERFNDVAPPTNSSAVGTSLQINNRSPEPELTRIPDRYRDPDETKGTNRSFQLWVLPLTCGSGPDRPSAGAPGQGGFQGVTC